MAKLTIKNPNWAEGDGPTTAIGTEVYIDGQRIDRVTAIELSIAVGEPVSATIHVWARPDEELTLPADVTVVVEGIPEASA
jgi:hypothetical protein